MNIMLLAAADSAKPEKAGAVSLVGGDANEPSGGFALLLASLVAPPPMAEESLLVAGDAPADEATPEGEALEVSIPAMESDSAVAVAPAAPADWLPEDLVASTPAPLLSAMTRAATVLKASAAGSAPTAEESVLPNAVALPTASTSAVPATKVEAIDTNGNSETLSAKAVPVKPPELPVSINEAAPASTTVNVIAPASKAATASSVSATATQDPMPEVPAVSAMTPKVATTTEPVAMQTVQPASVVVDAKVVSTEAAPMVAPALVKPTQNAPKETTVTSEATPEVAEEADTSSPLRVFPKPTPAAGETASMSEGIEEVELPLSERQQVVHTTRAFAQAAMASFDPESKPSSSESLLPDPSAPRGIDGSTLRTDAPQSATREIAPASNASTLPSTALAEPVEVPAPEVGRFALRGVRQMLEGGEQRMTLKVLPESLGEVQIEVIRNGNDVQVRMSATTQNVREMLDAQTHTLREALTREGFDAPRIQVTLQSPTTSSNGGHWNEGASHETRHQHQQSGHGPRHGSSQPNQTGDHAARTAAHLNGGGALNVTV